MMKKTLSVLIGLSMLVCLMSFSVHADMNPGVKVSAQTALICDMSTNQVLYAKDAEKRMNPVGLSNILTALTVVNNTDELSATVEIKQKVLDLAGDHSLGVLEDGEKYKLEDLLYLLVLKNDAAAGAVLADYICGSQDRFVALMNDLAQQYGMTNSLFSNAMGLYDMADENYTDCFDTTKLMKQAMDHPLISSVLSAGSHEMAAVGKDIFTVNTGCALLKSDTEYYDDSIVAAKSSDTDKAGHCMISIAEKGDTRLVCILYNGTEDKNYTASDQLFDWGFGLNRFVCIKQGEVIESIDVKHSYTKLDCIAKSDVTYLCDSTFDKSKLTVEHAIESEAVAPIKKGIKIGIVKVRYDGELVAAVDLSAGNDIEVSIGEQIQTPPLALRLTLLIIVILAIIVIFFIYRKKWVDVTK